MEHPLIAVIRKHLAEADIHIKPALEYLLEAALEAEKDEVFAPENAALVFLPDGEVQLVVPGPDVFNKDEDVPPHILAATEAFLRIVVDEDPSVTELADEFTKRDAH